MQIWPGQPYPLGATFDGVGTNFSIFSEAAQRVELCLFDEAGKETRVDLPEVTALCWHVLPAEIRPGPALRLSRSRALGTRARPVVQPAQAAAWIPTRRPSRGMWDWNEAVFPYHFAEPENSKNDLDSAPFCPRSIVINPYFDWGHDRRPNTPWHKTVVYETHVKGFTKRHPDIPERAARNAMPGWPTRSRSNTCSGSASPPSSCCRCTSSCRTRRSRQRGCATTGATTRSATWRRTTSTRRGKRGEQVQEFKHLVKTLHDAGIEVILDVVYNHTAEGNHLGPMLSFKGIDNAAYYRLMPDNRRYYMDYTGTGNTLNMRHPHVLQLIMDSLRYWVIDMHVDGFRFDLAATLARELHDVDRLSAFFDIIQQDPVISQVKLIAEPWDVGEGGYQVGNFPPLWSEWNGKYRDTVRDFWRGTDQTLAEFAYRFTGSSDLYEGTARRPYASINFITAHDGFTLRDLVSYNEKHNEANGEDNRDGESHNRSWNCGVEGPTDDPKVLALRNRQVRNFLTTLMLSQGVPMLLGGDEIGRTQQGNNNGYCQDNEISWYDWADADEDLLAVHAAD